MRRLDVPVMMPALPALTLAACLLLVPATGGSGELPSGQQAPTIAEEPPSVVSYAASSGARLRCAARGQPPPHITWLGDDYEELTDLPGHRRLFPNGTLELLPAAGATSGVPPRLVRCRAHNALGVALSRDVTLEPVADVPWEALAVATPAAAGGVATVTCSASAAPALVSPAVWYRGARALLPDTLAPEARYVVADDTLLIRDVSAMDAGDYSCLARHRLTGRARRSPPAALVVTTGPAPGVPRPRPARSLAVPAGAQLCLPCAAPDHPPPHYSWYHERDGRLQPLRAEAAVWPWAGGAALCIVRAAPAHAGAWLCKAAGARGDSTAHFDLAVHEELVVSVEPAHAVAAAGGTVRFNCSVRGAGAGAALRWLHDGAAAGAGSSLVVRGAARAHAGVYQCVARRGRDSAQAAATLTLGESPPELLYTFIEQALRPGGAVSLRCAAAGRPAPHIAWLRDQRALDHARAHHRYFINEESSANGDVVSVLNISSVLTEDGGRYTCRAHNEYGEIEHSARLNIYGPPSIRALGPVRVVAGANATIYCPYAGYPISTVWWRAPGGRPLAEGGRVAARGGELRLRPALAADGGRYVCGAAPPTGPAATMDVDLQVRNPPKISPFMFSPELTEGSSVQVLCGVSSGDKPMYFSWLKDGAPLPTDLQIEEKSLNEFSLLMFSGLTARHSGRYTCRVTNHAAAANYSAVLSVKVAPTWLAEPLDTAVLVDAPLKVDCVAKGYPTPTITWYRQIGDSSVNSEVGEQWEPIVGGEWSAGGAARPGRLRVENGSLLAAAATRAHSGVYRCQADNGVGAPLLHHVNVSVHVPASVRAGPGAANVSAAAGRGAELACTARGDRPLAVRWTRAGRALPPDGYRWSLAEAVTAEGLQSTLRLRAARRDDAGEYRCLAHNQFGSSELPLYLHVEEPPAAPGQLRLLGLGARWVRVSWRAARGGRRYSATYTTLPARPDTQLTVNLTVETSPDVREDADGHHTLNARLESLQPAAAYSLRLAAENHVGRSPPSDPLLFTTLEEAPSASPQNVRVRPVSSGELHVSWSAPPQDSWNGELLGYVVSWRSLGAEDAASGAAVARGAGGGELALGGLRPGARYALSARAFTSAGAGPAGPAVYTTTADGVPEVPPSSVTCETVSPRSLRVRWIPPATVPAHTLRGYDLYYTPLHFSSLSSESAETMSHAGSGEAALQGLRPATNYSVRVAARAAAGVGPASAPLHCVTAEDVPGAARAVRALPAAADAVRVTWLAPSPRTGRITHYTLYTRELGKVGGEWSQRVEPAGEEEVEAGREVRGLRERTVYEFWVRAATAAGAGAPTRPVTAAPAHPAAARVWWSGRALHAAAGGRVRLRCAATGAEPLRRRWTPLPPQHALADDGDLLIHKVDPSMAGNYSCSVRNAAGSDVAVFSLSVSRPPAAPTPRVVLAGRHELRLAWDAPPDAGAALIGYSVSWAPAWADATREVHSAELPAARGELTLRSLACGALYHVTARAHNALGASPPSRPLLARTRGDKASAPPGKEFVWANSTTLRLNLLAWGGRCPVAGWSVSLRRATDRGGGDGWRTVPASTEAAEANDLTPGTWYEIRVLARSPAGDTAATYRAATLTSNGERIGEPRQLPEARSQPPDGAAAAGPAAALGSPLLAAALAAALAALAATLLGFMLARRRTPLCLRRECSLHRVCEPHPQLYTTEPGKRNGKTLSPPDGDLNEISPYATFSMSGGEQTLSRNGCALHLRTFGRAASLDLGAPPPRPNLLAHAQEYGAAAARDSDSESSGSPCAACAAARRPPAASPLGVPPDLPPGVPLAVPPAAAAGGTRGAGRRRRRGPPRPHTAGSDRYFPPAALRASRQPL